MLNAGLAQPLYGKVNCQTLGKAAQIVGDAGVTSNNPVSFDGNVINRGILGNQFFDCAAVWQGPDG